MYSTAAEFRAQVEALETPAIENCIAQCVARSSTATRAGIGFNCLSMDALSNSQRVQIAREVLAERLAAAAVMVADAFKTEAEAKAEAAFDAMMGGFETEVEGEEIAALAQAARELAEEEEATARLRWVWQMGQRRTA